MSGTHQKFPNKFFLYYRMSMTSHNKRLICDKTLKTDINVRKLIDPVEIFVILTQAQKNLNIIT
jgi:hypothetical protein